MVKVGDFVIIKERTVDRAIYKLWVDFCEYNKIEYGKLYRVTSVINTRGAIKIEGDIKIFKEFYDLVTELPINIIRGD